MSYILILHRIIRHASLAVALATLIGLGGCSTLQVVYNNSEDLIYWWLDGYVDLQGEQKQFTRHSLSELQNWHRETQLADYVSLLKRMQALSTGEVTPSQVCSITLEMKDSFIAVLRHMEPTSAQLFSELSEQQLRSVRTRLDKNNNAWREDWLDPEPQERLRYRIKQTMNRLEDFYGHLDKSQSDAVNAWMSSSTFEPRMSYAERERRQADIMQTLERIAHEGNSHIRNEQAQQWLHVLVDRAFNSPNERYRAYNSALWDENCTGFANLHNSTTSTQRQHLLQTLRRYEQDFKTLMTQK